MICVSILPKNQTELHSMLGQAQSQGDLVELRVDALEQPCPSYLAQAVSNLSVPLILTLRSRDQGGLFEGNLAAQLSKLAALNPDFLDVEESAAQIIPLLRQAHPDLKLIASRHILHQTPKDLDAPLEQLQRIEADVHKLVCQANSTTDALRLFHLSRKAGAKSCVFAMGEFGSCTRILGPLAQNPWTYACLESGLETASGQLSAQQLRDIYHHQSLGVHTQICGLIGDPITASPGYLAHNHCYHALAIDAVYVSLRVRPGELEETLALVSKLPWRGMSVTIPHKQQLENLVDDIEEQARTIGAINTLTFAPEGILAANTDAAGALDAIERHLTVKGERIVILGAGGAVRAVAHEAMQRGAQVLILARRPEQAEDLATDLKVDSGDLTQLSQVAKQGYSLLINATPADITIPDESLLTGRFVMDLRSRPKVTGFLKQAIAQGCKPIYGIEMFTLQAAGQLERWFPQCAPRERLIELLNPERL